MLEIIRGKLENNQPILVIVDGIVIVLINEYPPVTRNIDDPRTVNPFMKVTRLNKDRVRNALSTKEVFISMRLFFYIYLLYLFILTD